MEVQGFEPSLPLGPEQISSDGVQPRRRSNVLKSVSGLYHLSSQTSSIRQLLKMLFSIKVSPFTSGWIKRREFYSPALAHVGSMLTHVGELHRFHGGSLSRRDALTPPPPHASAYSAQRRESVVGASRAGNRPEVGVAVFDESIESRDRPGDRIWP